MSETSASHLHTFLALIIASAVLCSGCSGRPDGGKIDERPTVQQPPPPAASTAAAASGWWCQEHGVPEHLCGRCDSQLAADFQKKGDWCPQHDRPDSQCFVCHPELQERFAAQFEARFGYKPPPPSE